MIVISAQEFKNKALNSSDSLRKVYHNKVLTPGVVFSHQQKDAAVSYCLKWMSNNPSFLCILVEDLNKTQVWYEQINLKISREALTKIFKKDVSPSLLESKYLQIDREFIARCQETLTESIGPIAKIIIKKVLARDNQSNRQQFITKLIQELQEKKQTKNRNLEEKLEELLGN